MISRRAIHVFTKVLLIASTLVLVGCEKLFDEPKKISQKKTLIDVNAEALLSASNLFIYTQMSEALSQAQALDGVITAFLHHPNPLALEEAQAAWTKTYSAYVKASFFDNVPRFEKPQFKENHDAYKDIQERLDSWPIEPGYIDYLPLYPLSGIVNDLTLKISYEDIVDQHGFSDLRFASLGFHPLEFLLFGIQGERSAKDFIPQENTIEVVSIDIPNKETQANAEALEESDSSTEKHDHLHVQVSSPQNHNRRREYLRLLSGLVVKHLQKLTDRWEPAHGYYAKLWRQPKLTQKIVNLSIVYQTVLDTLQYTLLEKHFQPLLTQKDVDDLRSPFSQQDVNNMLDLLGGIEQLFQMENGFISEIKKQDAETADKLIAQFKRLMTDMQRLPKELAQLPIAKRKELLTPIQTKVFHLFEQLHHSANVLRLTVRPIPVSTT